MYQFGVYGKMDVDKAVAGLWNLLDVSALPWILLRATMEFWGAGSDNVCWVLEVWGGLGSGGCSFFSVGEQMI